jgi:hypothetical protein
MTEHQQQLLDELRQICTQYQREVPTRRRPWPESIRGRILRLKELGLSFHTIASETGIPAMTLYSWGPDGKTRKRKKSNGAFVPVRVSAGPAVVRAPTTVTVPSRRKPGPRPSRKEVGTVTVVLTNGIRLEGLDTRSAVALARELSRS